MMDSTFTIELVQQADYRFEIHFDNPAVPLLTTDEAPPLGSDAGPNPARLLTAAVANCLSASLLFALRKFNNNPGALRASATTSLVRAHNRLRVGRIQVDIYLGGAATELKQLERAATDCRVCGATEKPAMYGFTTPLTDLWFDQALQAEPNIGLLLPCNVIVREEAPGRMVVGFLDLQTMVGLVGKTEIQLVADQAEKCLRQACTSLGGSAAV